MKTTSFLSYIKRAHSTHNLPCAFFALTDQWPKASIPLFDSRSRNLGRVNTVRPLSLSTMYQSQAAVASWTSGRQVTPPPRAFRGTIVSTSACGWRVVGDMVCQAVMNKRTTSCPAEKPSPKCFRNKIRSSETFPETIHR